MKSGREVHQEVHGDVEQLAGGSIYNNDIRVEVHVERAVLHAVTERDSEAWQEELELHRRFKAETGIECSRPARRALEPLLMRANFTHRQLRVVLRNGALVFDDDVGMLAVRVPYKEALYGAMLFFVAMLLVSPAVFAFVVADTTPLATAAFLLAFSCYSLAMAYLARFHVEPWQIAKRLQKVLSAGRSEAWGCAT